MALITLAEYKIFKGETGSDNDTLWQIYVDAADAFIKKYTKRDLEETSYEDQVYDGPGVAALVLQQYPIISIEDVYENEEEVEEREDQNDYEGWYLKNDGADGIIYHAVCWNWGRGIITVSYTAGYSTVPSDLKLAAYMMTDYIASAAQKSGIRSESLGSYAYSLANDLAAMGGELTIPDILIKNVLDRYKKYYIGPVV